MAETGIEGPVFGVPWVEVEFGQRPEGWALFLDREQCIEETRAASKRGAYSDGSGYCGPERPLRFHEIPLEGLDAEYAQLLAEHGVAHTSNYWNPKYRSGPMYVAAHSEAERK